MENNDQPVIDVLYHLISIAEDGKYGYETAAKDVTDDRLKSLFHQYADERREYIRILQNQVRNLGGEIKPNDDGGPIGAIHRTWIDFKSLVTGGDRDPILKACITGEEAAVSAYKKAIENPIITGATMQIVAAQSVGVESALKIIREHLEDESFRP